MQITLRIEPFLEAEIAAKDVSFLSCETSPAGVMSEKGWLRLHARCKMHITAPVQSLVFKVTGFAAFYNMFFALISVRCL